MADRFIVYQKVSAMGTSRVPDDDASAKNGCLIL